MCDKPNTLIVLSEEAASFEIDEMSETIAIGQYAEGQTDNEIKTKTLPALVWFYISISSVLVLFVFGFAALENIYKWPNEIVTDKVVICLISGITIQVAAVIVAAYKGLFDKKGD